jgi:mitochondrial fission protein ELM1
MKNNLKILVLDDGNRGNFVQSFGIASAFESAEIKTFKAAFKGPCYKLPGRKGRYPIYSKILALMCRLEMWELAKKALNKMLVKNSTVLNEKYHLIVSAGSVLSPVNLILSRGKSKSVQVMLPSMVPFKTFDFLVIPQHDYIKMKDKNLNNLIVTFGAPNLINEKFLMDKRKEITDKFNISADKKIIGLIIGGDDNNYRISVGLIEKLCKNLEKIKKDCNFVVTTSRRTEENVVLYLKENFSKHNEVIYSEFPGYSKNSYYAGLLAISDFLLVTEDSINMISEAAATGKPLIILGVERKHSGKLIFDQTIQKFVKNHYAEYLPFDRMEHLSEKLEESKKRKTFSKLNEAEKCALIISKTLN